VAVLAAPVLAGDEVVAVLQFCLAERHTEDDAFAQIIAAAAARLGSVLARKRHDAAHARPLPAPQHGELGQTASAAGTPTQTAALESLFQALVESGPDAVVITDSEGRIVLVNRQTEVLFGYRRDELVGQPVEHLLPERLREAHVRHRARYAAAPRARAIGEGQTLLARRKDGSEVPVDISLSPVETASGVVIKTAIRDITWWRDIEQQREEFLSSVTHDLRAPAAAIKASVGVVLANEPADLPVPLHRMLVNIDISADRMEQLAADLLDLARLRAGDTPFETVRCDLRTVARRAAQQIEPLAQARDQHLELDLPATPVWAPVDAQRLERALGNLLSNAHKYGRTGGRIQLALEHRRRPAAGGGRATDGGAADGEAVLTVMDDGPGIAPEDQAHIFDRFFRAPASAGHVTGSGLGLAIARAIAERHGGRLWVDSVLGQGATFSLAVPMNAAAQVAPPPGPRPPWAAVTGREDDRAVAPSRKDRVAELDRHLWQLRERQQRRLRAEGVALRAQGLHLRQFGRNLREHTGAGRLGRAALAAWVDALTVYHRQISDWNARMAAYQRRRIGPAGH
jgi:protein-histidine pros-kinase